MPSPPMKILVVEDNPGDARLLLEQLKEEGRDAFEIHWTDRLQAALATVEKHAYDQSPSPFDVVLLDLNLGDSQGLDTFTRLHEKAPQLPVVLLTGLEDEGIGLRAVQIGAQDYLVKGQATGPNIARAIRFAVERNRSLQWHRSKSRHQAGGRLIAVLGVKGGVGTTTVALNVAAALGADRLVAAAEFTTGIGHFAAHLRGLSGPSAAQLFALPHIDAPALEQHLVNTQLGFYALIGPAIFDALYSPGVDRTRELLDLLESMVDYAVLDLPSAWSAAHLVALRKAHAVVLVSERDELSLAAAQSVATHVRKIGVAQDALRLALVNRSPSLDAISKEKLEQLVGISVAGIVPPSADICLASHRAGAPLTLFRPHSAPAGALAAIAQAAAAVANPAAISAAS